ncbi:hypothetical protein [Clostridium sp. D53t1_180928_C8]|uniref:hypothetical protein n=1 Tax=Clostridium sp. D53t1_180928_C8 TaxID=2787101 RepID=UPI0018AB5AB4|nr:hypothetical protein [Clostridium sp. D53t1_180928_C8]
MYTNDYYDYYYPYPKCYDCNGVKYCYIIGPQGQPGTIENSPNVMANFIINQPDITLQNNIIKNGDNITGWEYASGQTILSKDKIKVSKNGIFTVVEPGIYFITSSLFVFPGGVNLSGQNINTPINSEDYYQGSFVLYFNYSNGKPYINAGEAVFTGYTKLANESATASLSYSVYLPEANMQFYIENASEGPIKLINGVVSGSAANLSIFRIGASVIN